jgi:hypothetical protein
VPVRLEDSHRNTGKSRSRAYIESRNLAIRGKVSGEEKGLAVVADHHLWALLDRGQVHSLVPTDKQFVMPVKLSDLRVTQLWVELLAKQELREPVRRGHRGLGIHRARRARPV